MVLSILSVWSPKTSATKLKSSERSDDEPVNISVVPVSVDKANSEAKDNVDASGASSPIGAEEVAKPSADPSPSSTTTSNQLESTEHTERPKPVQSRFSFRSFGFFYGTGTRNTITHEQDLRERQKASIAAKRESLSLLSRSADRRAQRNAIAVQRLIVGPGAVTPANPKTQPVSRTQLTKIKSELMKPKSANRLIAKLRELPSPEAPTSENDPVEKSTTTTAAITVTTTTTPAPPPLKSNSIPIHAVCLESTEAEVQTHYFSKLNEQSVVSSSIDALTSVFSELHIVDLLTSPDLGFGQPGDGKGLLAGAVPTAETVIEGAAKLTPQLMALGYATGQAILPDHTTLHPPTDRLSILTYWWGLELCLPPPTLQHLSQAPNIAHQIINFLSALALMNNGVREVLPFVRYIGQFVDFEWAAIERQDKGRGVVCAATWVMPAAMVARPWDFPDAPPAQKNPTKQPSVPGPPLTGEDAIGHIIKAPSVPLPTLVVTPPSAIKKNPQETPKP